MDKHFLQYPKRNISTARMLRRNMTDAERKLWSKVRNNQLGTHFRRGVPYGPYICDFLSIGACLVMEVDGGQHYTENGREGDARRDAYLREQGFEVLRFSDIEVLTNLDGVLQTIYSHVHRVE